MTEKRLWVMTSCEKHLLVVKCSQIFWYFVYVYWDNVRIDDFDYLDGTREGLSTGSAIL